VSNASLAEAGEGRNGYLSSFGRNRGRSLSPYQQGLVAELLPQLKVPSPSRGEDGRGALYGETSSPHAPTLTLPLRGREGDTAVPVTNTHAANDAYQRTALEIGFGAGEHLAAQARHHPETLYLGSEPYINGVAKLLAVIEREKLTNIRIDTRDVRELISELPGAALNEIFILFPDPWPKARHHKRRLINAQTLAMLQALKQGAVPVDSLIVSRQALQVPGLKVLVDAQGWMAKRYDGQPGTTYLLRPDQHVLARWRSLDSARLQTAMARALGQVGEQA
jgi:hypothetical protein